MKHLSLAITGNSKLGWMVYLSEQFHISDIVAPLKSLGNCSYTWTIELGLFLVCCLPISFYLPGSIKESNLLTLLIWTNFFWFTEGNWKENKAYTVYAKANRPGRVQRRCCTKWKMSDIIFIAQYSLCFPTSQYLNQCGTLDYLLKGLSEWSRTEP